MVDFPNKGEAVMNERECIERISSYVTSELAKARGHAGIGHEEDLIELGILDSISIVRLVGFIETTFDVEVLDEDLAPRNFQTIKSIAAYVEHRLDPSVNTHSAA